MTDSMKRALRTTAQTFVSTVVTLWGAAAVFSQQGVIDTAAAKRFALAVVSALIASGLSLGMSLVYGAPTAPPAAPEVPK